MEASPASAPSGEREGPCTSPQPLPCMCVCVHGPPRLPAHTCSDTMAQRPGSRAAHFVLLTRGP